MPSDPPARVPDAASESRLRELRERARDGQTLARGVRPDGAPMPSPETGYYALPVLKPPTWTWEVPLYLFVGGAAGAIAVIGCVARASRGHRRLSRDARLLAAAGGALSGALLTSDLGRPERFLYMLRVFKRRSPMSVGAWILTVFSASAGAAAFAEVAERVTRGRLRFQWLGEAGAAVAGATGLGMCTYTGVLLGATAVPVWNRNVALLPVHFGASALASGVSALEAFGHRDPALRRLAILAATAEVLVGLHLETAGDTAIEPLRHGPSGTLTRLGGLFSGPLPLALRLWPRRSSAVRRTTALMTMAGSILTRIAWVAAGKVSTRDSHAGSAASASRPRASSST